MTPRKLLGQARVECFNWLPYLCSFVYSLREQETPGIGTAAVDEAGNLYWDPEFITEIGREQGAYLILHETLHVLFEHHARAREIIGENASEFDRFVCNVAADLVVEQVLQSMRHLRPEGAVYLGCEVPAWGIRLDFPENKSVQTYYRLILDKLKVNEQKQGQQGESGEQDDNEKSDGGSSSSDAGGGQPQGNATGDGDADFIPDDDGTEADGRESPSSGGAGSPSSGPVKAPQKPGAPGTGGSCADGQPRPYEIESDGSWETYAGDMAAARTEQAIAEYEASHPGTVPGNIKEALKCKLRPQPDPFDQLRSAVCTSVASPIGGRDFSRRRRSRKQPPDDNVPLLHGRITTQPHAVVIVDTSGSMMGSETKAKALSVIGQGIRKLSRVKVFCADTHVRSNDMVATTSTFAWCGGGGTDMARAIEEVDRTDKPDSIILVTDAETDWPKRQPHARVVVAYTGHPGSHWHQSIPRWCRTITLQGGSNA